MIKQKKAFTLVELIVVITILAILGTIAFISLQGYSSDARDSVRTSDLSRMRTSLELFHLDAGKYPIPTGGIPITYSGGTVWTQGTFGDSVLINVQKLDKIPKDPLTEKEYTYSVTTNEYELAGMLEGDPLSFDSHMLDGAYAGDVEATAIVTGNYNGLMSKTIKPGTTTCYALALPTIIANDLSTPTLENIIDNDKLVYDGYNNLPSNLSGTKFNVDGGFDYGSGATIVAYTDTGSCAPLTDANDTSIPTAREELFTGLQDAYKDTVLKGEGEISTVVSLSGSIEIGEYAASFVNNNLGGKISLASGNESGGGETPPVAFSCGDTVSALGETYTTILGPDGNCWTSQNMRHGNMLTDGSTMPSDIDTIEKWCYGDSTTNCDNEGGLYTWSEAMGFADTCNTTNCAGPENTAKSVCGQLLTGWGLPTDAQWTALTNAGATGWTLNKLSGIVSSLPGRRNATDTFYGRGIIGYWWSSTEGSSNTRSWYRQLRYAYTTVDSNNFTKAYGFSVVCIKN